MRIDEITRIISDNAFEVIINRTLYNEINIFYNSVYNEFEKFPNLMACDIFGEDYHRVKQICINLLNHAHTIYPPGSISSEKLEQILTYMVD